MAATQVGAELHDVDFGELIRSVSQGIADGQFALDMASIHTLQVLSATPVSVIPEITEVITPSPFDVAVSGQSPVTVTGARVDTTPSAPIQMSALQAGILPTFYQFTEATIALKIAVSMRQSIEQQSDGTLTSSVRAFGSHVNFRNQNTYSMAVDASSTVNVTMRPVPPPRTLQPTVVTVNAMSKTPVVSTSL
jgi:hypothetical protein